MCLRRQTAEITSPSTRYTASRFFSRALTVLTSPPCACSTNASIHYVQRSRATATDTRGYTARLADPFILAHVRIDRGAIRFLLAGAHMMCPGLTSAGGWLPPADAALPAGTPVAFEAEGKEFAVGVGITKLGTEEMRKVNKGIAVESVTYIGDDLWALQKL